MPESQTLLREGDLAKLLNVSVAAARSWRCRHAGPPYVKFQGTVRYLKEDVLSWLGEKRIVPRGGRVAMSEPQQGVAGGMGEPQAGTAA